MPLRLSFFYLFILPFSGYAQLRLTGRITGTKNKSIEFANVFLTDTNHKLITGVITDKKGQFQLKTKKGKYTLTVSFVGYTNYTKEIILDKNKNLGNIILKETADKLKGVVITAKKRLIERKDDKIIFNVANSPFSKGYNAVEVLRQSPSIWIGNSGNILIHNTIATILVNGKKINLSSSDLENYIKTLDSDDIEKITIQTNASANIDATNTGGIVNIILKKNLKGFKSRLKSYYTQKEKSFYNVSSSINFNYGTEKWNIYGNYGYLKNTDNPVYQSDNFNKKSKIFYKSNGNSDEKNNRCNYQLGLVYDISKKQKIGAEAFGSIFSNTSMANTNINVLKNTNGLDNGVMTSTQNDKNTIFNGVFNYSLKMDAIGSVAVFIDYIKQNVNNKNKNVSAYDLGFFDNSNDKNKSTSGSTVFSSQVDFKKNIKQLFNFDTGVKYTATNRDNDLISETLQNGLYLKNNRTSSFHYNEKVSAGYFSASKKIKKYFIKMGLRYENTSFKGTDLLNSVKAVKQTYGNFFPSLYVSKNLKNDNTISVSYSRNIKRPSFNNLSNRVLKLDDFNYDIGNPQLKPSYINNYSISFNTRKQVFSLFYSETLAKINQVWFVKNGINYHQHQNYGNSRQVGIEYGINTNIKKWWFANLKIYSIYRKFKTAIYSDSKPSFMAINYNVFKINQTTSIDFSMRYVSSFIESNFTFMDSFESTVILKKTFLKKKLNLQLSINDIFNTLRDKSTGRFKNLNTYFYQKRKTRSFMLRLSYSFDNGNKVSNEKNSSKNDTRNRL